LPSACAGFVPGASQFRGTQSSVTALGMSAFGGTAPSERKVASTSSGGHRKLSRNLATDEFHVADRINADGASA